MPKQDPAKGVTRDLPPLQMRASFRPDSVNAESRTAEVVWTTGARVLRGFWDRYFEELSLDPAHVRMERLQSGRAPFLNSHDSYSLDSVLGVITDARLDGDKGIATIRFPKEGVDERADQVFRKVQDGIIANVSVGYRVHRFEQVEGGDEEIPVMRATDWEPFEVSAVAMPADAGAGFRNTETEIVNPCLFVTRRKENTMDPKPNIPAAEKTEPVPAPSADTVMAAEQRGAAAERERITEIRKCVSIAKLGNDVAEHLIRDGVAIDKARALVFEKLAAKADEVPTNPQVRVEAAQDIGRESSRTGMLSAILHRTEPDRFKLDDAGRQFRGMRLIEMARESLSAAGINTRGMGTMEVAGLALGVSSRAGALGTSDFPNILADVANKTLRMAYEEAPQTFQAISRRTTLPDFKSVKRNQLGEAPQLKKVLEDGEFTRGSIGEGKETYALSTYGRVVAFSRQALINDDMGAFSRVPMLFGRSARDKESDLVWEQITTNPVMGDSVALFHATHGNLAGSAAAISVTSVALARTALRKQKGVDAVMRLNITPKYLIVPAGKETIADQFVSTAMLATQDSNKNPFAGRLTVIAEPRLDDTATIGGTAWYITADPSQLDMVEYAYLEGEEGPMLETRIGFDVDGMEIKCRHDFAAKVIDYRGFYRNDGA